MTAREKTSLAAEILAAYGSVRWSLWRDELPRTVVRLRGPPAGVDRRAPSSRESERLARSVVRMLALLPAGSRCLTRSLVLVRLLARRGVHGSLVIAVRPSEDLALAAHAWVEVDGRPILVPALEYGRLITL